MQTSTRWASAAILITSLAAWPIAAGAQTVVARWIELGPGSSAAALASGSYGDQPHSLTPTILARAIVSDGTCPGIAIDGAAPVPMALRVSASGLTSTPASAPSYPNGKPGYPAYFVNPARTSPASFPDGTAMATTRWAACESVVPAGHATATIGGVSLKLPVAEPKRILVIADTGCRMAGRSQQDCHAPDGFPFAALANYEALLKPDLIIHSGDYFYRDSSCVTDGKEYLAGCDTPSSPNYETWGDTLDSWNADFFYPGANLLATAPWVMVRGNHESCGRGARGWFALLDPHPYNAASVKCAGGVGLAPAATGAAYSDDFTPSYIVPAGGVNLLVHDSSFANDTKIDSNLAKNYDYDMTSLLAAVPDSSYNIYVTHKPTFGLFHGKPTDAGNMTEQYAYTGAPSGAASAFAGGVPLKIALFLAGHIHQFQYVNFEDHTRYAPQMIVGMAGDKLDKTANPDGTNPDYGYAATPFAVHNSTGEAATAMVAKAFAQAEFGFAVLDATPTGFTANVYTIGSNKVGRCTITLSPRNIACWG